ncbi:MAG: Glu/Leu/Phe/Val dehydrogenase dimerization domain-containing protein [Gammaproteobacteria bacterium]
MSVFSNPFFSDHEEVVFVHDDAAGLRAIVAIHDTTLGPALGGLRLWPYASEDEALTDVLRLSRGMTYKAAIAGLNLGGGKSVIMGDPSIKSEALFRSFGRYIQGLAGRYITAEDVNINVEDIELIYQETEYAVGIHPEHGGSGDPSPFTAWGAFQGMRAALEKTFGQADWASRSIAIQGVGHVGLHLARLLRKEKAQVFVTDIHADRVQRAVEEYGCEAVTGDQIYDLKVDVFAPCALGGSINPETLPRLRCKIVAGSANNQLATPECGTELDRRGILYTPDYALNAGGLINVALEIEGYQRELAERRVNAIYDIIKKIFEHAAARGIPTWKAADAIAEERIAALTPARGRYLENPPMRRIRQLARTSASR